MIRAVRWCISALLLLLAWQVHADARNVIVFFINGANQAGLEFARAAGADFAGLSNLSAFPVRGTLLPLTGEYRHLPLAAANAVALGKPVYVMPTYTAMLALRGTISKEYGYKEFWQ